MKDLSNRLNEEVANATKAAKRDALKLQARIQELEAEVADATKAKTDVQRLQKK